MIDVMFRKGSDMSLVRINNTKLMFAKVMGGHMVWTDIEGIKFSVAGVLNEFPDLKEKTNTQIIKIGRERFTNHIKELGSEEEIRKYLIKDLEGHGFKALFYKRKGFRPVRCQS